MFGFNMNACLAVPTGTVVLRSFSCIAKMKEIGESLNMQRLMEKAPTGLHDFCEELIEHYFDKSNNLTYLIIYFN